LIALPTKENIMDNETAQVVAHLAVSVKNLTDEKKELKEAISNIHGILFSIGGPLNDNFKQYSKEQLVTFTRIYQEIQGVD